MENITIKLNTAGVAFTAEPASEIARVLRGLATKVEQEGEIEGPLFDARGELCGEVSVYSAEE